MEAHPQNFTSNVLDNNLNIVNVKIKCENSVILLGVTIDKNLNFNEQVLKISKKASAQT